MSVAVTAGAAVASSIFLIWLLVMATDETMLLAIAWFAPFLWLVFLVATYYFGYTLANWHGHIEMRLLLKLLDQNGCDDRDRSCTEPAGRERTRC